MNTYLIMYGFGTIISFLIIENQLVFGNFHCVVRNDLKSSDIGIRNAALSGLKIDGERKKTELQVFECHCGSDSVKIKVLYVTSKISFTIPTKCVTFTIVSRCFENQNNNCCETNLATLLPRHPSSSVTRNEFVDHF